MAIEIADLGAGNRIEIDPEVALHSSGKILLRGDANSVVIGRGCSLANARIELGSGCGFEVGIESRLAAIEVMAARDGLVQIGERTNFTWHTRLLLHEPGRITIGSGCLIASDTLVTVSDMHSILDRRTGARINPAADVSIGDHVWLAHGVVVLKGVRIGDGAVVGLGSIVSRDVAAHVLAAGRPASTRRREIDWSPALL